MVTQVASINDIHFALHLLCHILKALWFYELFASSTVLKTIVEDIEIVQPHDDIITTETIHKFPKTTKVQVANVKSCSRQGASDRFFWYANLGRPHYGWRLGY